MARRRVAKAATGIPNFLAFATNELVVADMTTTSWVVRVAV
jgi:hypothetical protein